MEDGRGRKVVGEGEVFRGERGRVGMGGPTSQKKGKKGVGEGLVKEIGDLGTSMTLQWLFS